MERQEILWWLELYQRQHEETERFNRQAQVFCTIYPLELKRLGLDMDRQPATLQAQQASEKKHKDVIDYCVKQAKNIVKQLETT